MKNFFFSAGILALAFTSCKDVEDKAVETGSADTIKVETPMNETAESAKAPDSAQMMKAWAEYAAPGDMHKLLASDAGKWNVTMTTYTDPAKPTKDVATAEIKMTMGGRYQEARFDGKIMGAEFHGLSTTSYNNASKKFESTWYDNMGTGLMFIQGEYDTASKSITYFGTVTDPMTKKEKKTREVYTWADADNRRIEMFDTDPSGKEFKAMQIELARK